MFLTEAQCLFMGFILCISGLQAQQSSICAPRGSSVKLSCLNPRITQIKHWYTLHRDGVKYTHTKLPADEGRVTYNMLQQSSLTLTINDLSLSDSNSYCCSHDAEQPVDCRKNGIQLIVTELQVKVFPATEGQTVTLMCSTSCKLTEEPAAYMWYRNTEFLYEDWSPWYQELVSSQPAVTYSCAVKGYQELRAPPVSVDSVTHTCFSVTYEGGRVCSSEQTSGHQSCSITYPTELHVRRTPAISGYVSLTCHNNCLKAKAESVFTKHYYGSISTRYDQQTGFPEKSTDSFSCAVEGHEDLSSAAVCPADTSCWSVNYVSRRLCALKGSSVNISCEYSHPPNQQPQEKIWFKTERERKLLTEDGDKVQFDDTKKNQQVLRLRNVQKNDSAEYSFSFKPLFEGLKQQATPGVTLIVTELTVTISPAEVTEAQSVTLTCSTSCPLSHNTNYMWFFNREPLSRNQAQSKQLVLRAVGRQHAGSYSCAVRSSTGLSHRSAEKSLRVQSGSSRWEAAVAGVCAAVLLLILLCVFWWIRKKRTSNRPPSSNTQQTVALQSDDPPEAAGQELQYSSIHFSHNHTDPLYSVVQPRQQREPKESQYASINFRSNTQHE